MIDILLLVEVSTLHLFRRFPNTETEAITVCYNCIGALKLWEMMQRIPIDKVASESHIKQILVEYFRRVHERKIMIDHTESP